MVEWIFKSRKDERSFLIYFFNEYREIILFKLLDKIRSGIICLFTEHMPKLTATKHEDKIIKAFSTKVMEQE